MLLAGQLSEGLDDDEMALIEALRIAPA